MNDERWSTCVSEWIDRQDVKRNLEINTSEFTQKKLQGQGKVREIKTRMNSFCQDSQNYMIV